MKMNKTTLPQFRIDFAKAVADLEAQYGVKIQLGNITYSTNDFHTRLEVKNVGTDETSSKELWLAEQSKAYWKNTLVKKVEYDKTGIEKTIDSFYDKLGRSHLSSTCFCCNP